MKMNFTYLAAVSLLTMCSLTACTQKTENKKVANSAEVQKKNQKKNTRGFIVKVGDSAPDFTITLTDGSSVQLSTLRGKVVMLQFTASWCGVCRKEMPFIERDIWQKYKDNPAFALLGIDRDEPLAKVIDFGKSVGGTYPLGLDPGAAIFSKFAHKEAGITRNVLIDREGKIVFLTRLYNEAEFASLLKKIEEML